MMLTESAVFSISHIDYLFFLLFALMLPFVYIQVGVYGAGVKQFSGIEVKKLFRLINWK